MAKRFEFRLEALLKIRKQAEDACKRAVADRLRSIGVVQGEIAVLQDQIRSEIGAFRRTHAVGRLDVTQVMRHRHWLIHLHQGALMGHARLAELQRRLQEDRAALAETRKRVRILEKLKERQYERYRRDLDRAEVRQNDEIGNILYVREKVLGTRR